MLNVPGRTRILNLPTCTSYPDLTPSSTHLPDAGARPQFAVLLSAHMAHSASLQPKCPFAGCTEAGAGAPGGPGASPATAATATTTANGLSMQPIVRSSSPYGAASPTAQPKTAAGQAKPLPATPAMIPKHLLSPPPTREERCAAWLTHFMTSPAHTRALMLSAKHTARRAAHAFAHAADPSGVARCWCGGCTTGTNSRAALLAHQAFFHHAELASTDWEELEVSGRAGFAVCACTLSAMLHFAMLC